MKRAIALAMALVLLVTAVFVFAGCSDNHVSQKVSELAVGDAGASGVTEMAESPEDFVKLEANTADRDAVRKEKAEKFAFALYTNTKIVNEKPEHDFTFDAVQEAFVSPNSELKEWSAEQDLEYDNSILMRGGSPLMATSAVVSDVQGDAYYVSVKNKLIASMDPANQPENESDVVVVFDGDDMILHAWHCGSENTSSAKLHGPHDAYAAYASKLGEIMEKHGRPGIAPDYSGQLSYATGLAYADLVDFGDGDHRLVACYLDMDNCKSPDAPGSYPEDYCVEVWQYSGGSLELVFSGTAQLDGQNTYCGAVMYNVHDGRDYIVTRSGSYGGPSGSITQYAYGLDDSGKFGLVTELTNNYSGQDSEYVLNGIAVSDAEGEAVAREWFDYESKKSHRLSTVGGSSYPFSLIRDTNTVVAVLEACAA